MVENRREVPLGLEDTVDRKLAWPTLSANNM